MASTFDTVTDLLPEPMALVSVSGHIHAANRAFATLAAIQKRLLVGRALRDAGWSTAGDWPDYLRRCARTRSLVLGAATHQPDDGAAADYRCEGALYQPAADGGATVVLLRFLPRESSSSKFIVLTQKVDELSREISRRQRAEARVREQHELLHVTLWSIGDAVIATDREGRVTFMNGVAERLTGWPLSDASGTPVQDVFRIVNEETRDPVEDPVAKVLASGQVVGLANHTLLVARDGTERLIDDSGAPITDGAGRIHGVVLVFRDVTELRWAQRQQQQARESAEAANRAKDEFLATLSHELRTPLNAILGWVHMLRTGSLEHARRAHALEVIERNAAVQARLIGDLLDVSRIMVGQLRLDYEAVDVRRIVDAAIDAIRPAVDNKSLRVSSSVRVASTIYGDPARLQQVVWNLLANAVKFTPPQGVITVDAQQDDGVVRIVVRDSGVGIPADFRPRMFEAFSQVDTTPTRPHGGLGLGLAIVRRLVEAHGGSVEADSAGENSGATFTVTLPVAPSTDSAAQLPG